MRLIVDAHCDTLMQAAAGKRDLLVESETGHLDLPRLLKAGVACQFFALFVDNCCLPHGALRQTLRMLDCFYQAMEREPGKIFLIRSRSDLEKLEAGRRVGVVLSIEGGEALESDPAVLRVLYRMGVRALGFTWNRRNQLADGVWEEQAGGGLTRFGREVLEEMNRLGMLPDVSHLAEKGFWDVLDLSLSPVIASHANCSGLRPHPRNLKDNQIKALARKGGVLGITFAPAFLNSPADIFRVAEQVDYACQLLGDADHVGFGSDFDGIPETPRGLEDVSRYPFLVEELIRRGYQSEDLNKIMGGNFLRVLREILP